jgi:hypothetical protein
LVDLITALILVVDLVLSIWNSYTAGFTYGMLRKNGGPSWMYLSAFLGLTLGLVGAVYVTAIVVGLVAYVLGWVDAGTIDLLLAYNYLIAGGLITALGIGATVESIYVAIKRPGVWTVAGALYNTFASIWNVFAYVKDFGPVTRIIENERRDDKQSGVVVIIIALVAIVLSVVLTYFAFWTGRNRAERQQRVYSGMM